MFYSTVIPDLIGNPDSDKFLLDSRWSLPRALTRGGNDTADKQNKYVQNPCQAGQALIESCIVIALICLLLVGLFQLSGLYSAKEITAYASTRGARARTVGFNDFMVRKAVLVGTIPNAGRMTFPPPPGGPLAQMVIERGRIPLYLSAEWHMLDGILQYEDWETVNYNYTDEGFLLFRFSVFQDLPLRYFPALFRAFYHDDSVPISTELRMDNHASLYLE